MSRLYRLIRDHAYFFSISHFPSNWFWMLAHRWAFHLFSFCIGLRAVPLLYDVYRYTNRGRVLDIATLYYQLWPV